MVIFLSTPLHSHSVKCLTLTLEFDFDLDLDPYIKWKDVETWHKTQLITIWPLTYDLELQFHPSQGQGRPSCQKSGSKVKRFKQESTDKRTDASKRIISLASRSIINYLVLNSIINENAPAFMYLPHRHFKVRLKLYFFNVNEEKIHSRWILVFIIESVDLKNKSKIWKYISLISS